MSLTDVFKNAYLTARAAADDAVIPALTYKQVTGLAYDPSTDQNVETTNDVALTNIFGYGLDEQEVDWFPADWEMQKIIIGADELGITPKDEDYVEIAGVTWRVKRVKRLPGDPIFILFLMKS